MSKVISPNEFGMFNQDIVDVILEVINERLVELKEKGTGATTLYLFPKLLKDEVGKRTGLEVTYLDLKEVERELIASGWVYTDMNMNSIYISNKKKPEASATDYYNK